MYCSPTKKMPLLTQCIYCKLEFQTSKSKKGRNPVEHVIPQMLGMFENNMTLKDIVCANCNKFFSKNTELLFGRDSVYGILYRSIVGLFKENEFKTSIHYPRKKLAFKINHSEYGQTLVDIQLSKQNLFEVRLAEQFILLNSTKGVSVHYPVNQLPHKTVLDSLGLPVHASNVNYIGPKFSPEEWDLKRNMIGQKLKVSGFNKSPAPKTISFRPPLQQDSQLLFSSLIDEDIIRVIAKIGFNYFAKIFGAELSNKDYFNNIRHFIRYGIKSGHSLVMMNKKIINENVNSLTSENFNHHTVVVFQNDHKILARVTLFNRDVFDILLTDSYPFLGNFIKSGHCFYLLTKQIQK
ncbi:TPA: hypothetical protein P5J11_002815, partial [Legionella pneumophila]|nr:hypothetical protein [Legionella pneumophila]